MDTRTDLDSGKLAFYGLSIGAEKGVILSAVETRLRAIVLMAGGFSNRQFEPEVDPLNFAPRVSAPVLMVNGRNDFLLDHEKLQLPLFRLLGPRESAKRHAVFEAGHIPRRADFIQEILDWLDAHLGPVAG